MTNPLTTSLTKPLTNPSPLALPGQPEGLFSRQAWIAIGLCVLIGALLPVLNLSFPPDHALHISSYTILLVGKFMCYALAALALDLVWAIPASCPWVTACSSRWAPMRTACT